ncbi:hypothetical protein TWF718_009735 [Orbilia javanica]|uniref:Uncharacterized protein n=1 Tax=Orbilia javanica TaxID=47235 RepID=A0AAN8MZP0_9PEZI
MIDASIQKSKRHSGTELPPELALEIELDDESPSNIDLVAIERTWSKRLNQLENLFQSSATESIPFISHEDVVSDPLARWYTETTTDGFFHNIGEVRKLSKRQNPRLDSEGCSQIHRMKFDRFGGDVRSDAGATYGLISEISRGLSRL